MSWRTPRAGNTPAKDISPLPHTSATFYVNDGTFYATIRLLSWLKAVKSSKDTFDIITVLNLHSAEPPPPDADAPPPVPLVLLLLLPLILPCWWSLAEDEDEGGAACEDVVAQSSVDLSARRTTKQKDILIARQRKFAHSARHALPLATERNRKKKWKSERSGGTHKSRHR